MQRWLAAGFVVALAGLISLAQAQEKPNPTGTWKWTVNIGGQSRDATLKLKLEGDKLTGSMLGRNNQETPIEDVKYSNGEFSFKVTRERNGQKIVTKYSGKITGDSIKGKTEFERDGQTQSRDWEAKRAP
jgi:hypothetical protein